MRGEPPLPRFIQMWGSIIKRDILKTLLLVFVFGFACFCVGVLKVQKISKGIIAIPVLILGEDTPAKQGLHKLHCFSPPQASTKKAHPACAG